MYNPCHVRVVDVVALPRSVAHRTHIENVRHVMDIHLFRRIRMMTMKANLNRLGQKFILRKECMEFCLLLSDGEFFLPRRGEYDKICRFEIVAPMILVHLASTEKPELQPQPVLKKFQSEFGDVNLTLDGE